MAVRTDLASLSPDDLAALREALRTKPGQRRLETRAAIEQRDDAIRKYARRLYPGLSRNAQAEVIARDLGRYWTTGWVRERGDLECRHTPGSRRALLWQIFKCVPRAIGARAINEMLSRSR